MEKKSTNKNAKIQENIQTESIGSTNIKEKNIKITEIKTVLKNEMNSINAKVDNNINNLNEFDNFLKNYFLENKNNIKKPKDFINYGNIVYRQLNLKEKFILAEYHIKNLYYKFIKIKKKDFYFMNFFFFLYSSFFSLYL